MSKTALTKAEKDIVHSSSTDNTEDNATKEKLPSMRKIVGRDGLRTMVDNGVEFLRTEREAGRYNPNYKTKL